MIGRNYHIQDYLRILCKFIYVSNGKFLNWICLSILILGVFRTKQEKICVTQGEFYLNTLKRLKEKTRKCLNRQWRSYGAE